MQKYADITKWNKKNPIGLRPQQANLPTFSKNKKDSESSDE